MRHRSVIAVSALLLSLAVCALAADKPKVRLREFTALDIENFENPKFQTKEPMPESWIPLIREDISQRVIQLHKFRRVMDFEDEKAAKPAAEKVLVLRGKITEYSQGSEAARRLIGLGAGKGKIVALCSFVDKATGNVIWERKVDGRVIGAGQSTEGAIKGLSKEVAGVIGGNW